MTRQEDQQSLTPGRIVELFDFDLSTIRGESSVYRWCSAFKESGDIVWRGETYTPLPIEATGFEQSGKGQLPTPSVRIANAKLVPTAIIAELGDPLGAVLTRWRVHEKYLDGNPYASTSEHYPKQVFVVERKKIETDAFVEFELSSVLDKEGVQLPRRVVLRNACLQRYRVFDSACGTFDYGEATCPWAGASSTTQSEATATISEGAVTLVAVTEAGSGYVDNTVIVSISGGKLPVNDTCATKAKVSPTITGGEITAIAVDEGGSGYIYDASHADYPIRVTIDVEGPYFDELDQTVTDPSKDRCGKRLSSCEARFGPIGEPLPGWFFPGAGRIR